MFGELPKLFGRDFALGHLLPAVLFLALTAYLLSVQGVLPAAAVTALTAENPWLGATLTVAVTWLGGIALLGANRLLIRGKEGYGLFNRDWNPFKRLERRRFVRLQRKFQQAKDTRRALQAQGQEVPAATRAELTLLAQNLAMRFPDEERHLLPTAFGNASRAFEVYSRVMYGAEATEIWERLLTVVPKGYRELMDLTKTQMDFWVNLWWLLLAVLVEAVLLVWLAGPWRAGWILVPAVLVAIPVASYQARQLAQQWGKTVKACFDVYLPELHRKLGLPKAASQEEQRQQWTRFSQAILFRHPKLMPQRHVDDEEAAGEAQQSGTIGASGPKQASEASVHKGASEEFRPWLWLGQVAAAVVIWLWACLFSSSSN